MEEELKKMNKAFLPLDAFDPMIDTEDPGSIINLYKD
jgi:hypothetical protein